MSILKIAIAASSLMMVAPLSGEVVHENIDVHAQFALQSLSRGDTSDQSIAHGMLADVEEGTLDGAYLEDQKVPALRAKAMGTWWGTLIPKGHDSILLMGVKAGEKPIIVIDNAIRSVKPRRDAAVRKAFTRFLALQRGDLRPCDEVKGGTPVVDVKPGDWCVPGGPQFRGQILDDGMASARFVDAGFIELGSKPGDGAIIRKHQERRKQVLRAASKKLDELLANPTRSNATSHALEWWLYLRPEASGYVDKVQEVKSIVDAALVSGSDVFVDRTNSVYPCNQTDSRGGHAHAWTVHTEGNPVTLCGPFFQRNQFCQEAIFIHEFFHTVGVGEGYEAEVQGKFEKAKDSAHFMTGFVVRLVTGKDLTGRC